MSILEIILLVIMVLILVWYTVKSIYDLTHPDQVKAKKEKKKLKKQLKKDDKKDAKENKNNLYE